MTSEKRTREEVEMELWVETYLKMYDIVDMEDAVTEANTCIEEFRKQFPVKEVKGE